MKLSYLSAALCLVALPAASDEAALGCLQEKVQVSNVKLVKGSYGQELTYDVSNNLGWAIGTIWIEYSVITEGRSVPWDEDETAMEVSGGIEPGETRTMTYRSSFRIPQDPKGTLVASVKIRYVGDFKKRQFIDLGNTWGDWPRETTPFECDD